MDDPRPSALSSLPGVGPAGWESARQSLKRSMRPEELFRAALCDGLSQLTANAAKVRAGHSVEALHQLRVALRRLDVVLKAFGEEFGQQWLMELRANAKALAGQLAPARDFDVFLTELLDAPAEENERAAFLALRAKVEEMGDKAWKEACQCVGGADFALFAEDVAALAYSRLPLARATSSVRVAKRLLDRQYARAMKRGRRARDGGEAHLHRLRIALKKLRYVVECLAPLFRRRKVRAYLKALKELQEHLGAVNDIAQARATVSALLREHGARPMAAAYAAGLVGGWYRARRPKIVKRALKRFAQFRKLKPFWA